MCNFHNGVVSIFVLCSMCCVWLCVIYMVCNVYLFYIACVVCGVCNLQGVHCLFYIACVVCGCV